MELGYGLCGDCGKKIGYAFAQCERCEQIEAAKYELLDWLRLQNRRRKNARLKSGDWGKGWLTESLVAALTQGATKNDWSLGKKEGKRVWGELRAAWGPDDSNPFLRTEPIHEGRDDVSELVALLTEAETFKRIGKRRGQSEQEV